MLIIEPRVFEDERGYFMETHHSQRFKSTDIDCTFAQDNLSFSKKNVLRGLHFQKSLELTIDSWLPAPDGPKYKSGQGPPG